MTCSLLLEIYVGTIAEPVRFTAIDTITYTLHGGNHTFSFSTQHPIAAWRFLDRAKVEVYKSGNLIYNGILNSVQYNFRRDQPQCRYQVNGYVEHLRRYPVTFRMTGKILGIIETILTEGKALDFISLVDTQYISFEKQMYDMTVDFSQQYAEQAINDVCNLLGVHYYIHPTSNVLVLYEPAYLVQLDHVINLDDTRCAELKIFNPELHREPHRYSRIVTCDSQEVLNLLARGIESQEDLQTMLSIPVLVADAPDRSFRFRQEGEVEKRTITAAFIRAEDAQCSWLLIAGTGIYGQSGDGGQAIDADIFFVSAPIIDVNGRYYLLCGGFGRIRMVDTDDIITTIAGTGSISSFTGIPGSATSASIGNVQLGVLMSNGDLVFYAYTTTQQYCLLRMAVGGNVSFIAGTTAANPSGMWDETTGTATSVSLGFCDGLTTDGTNVYFWQNTSSDGYCLLKVDGSGNLSLLAGKGTLDPADNQSGLSTLFDEYIPVYNCIAYADNKIFFFLRSPSDSYGALYAMWYYDLSTGNIRTFAWNPSTAYPGLAVPEHNMPYATARGIGEGYQLLSLRAINDDMLISGWNGVANIPSALLFDMNSGKQYYAAGLPFKHNFPANQDVYVTSQQSEAFVSGACASDANRILLRYTNGKQVTSLTCVENANSNSTLRAYNPSMSVFTDIDLGHRVFYSSGSIVSLVDAELSETINLTGIATGTFYFRLEFFSLTAPPGISYDLRVKINGNTEYSAMGVLDNTSASFDYTGSIDLQPYTGSSVTIQVLLSANSSGWPLSAFARFSVLETYILLEV